MIQKWIHSFSLNILQRTEQSIKIPQIWHNRDSLCRQFFSDPPLRQAIYFSNFCHTDNFFPNHDTPLGKVMIHP